MTEFAEAILSVGWFLLILILGVLGVCSVAVIARPLPRASTASRTRRARPTRMRVPIQANRYLLGFRSSRTRFGIASTRHLCESTTTTFRRVQARGSYGSPVTTSDTSWLSASANACRFRNWHGFEIRNSGRQLIPCYTLSRPSRLARRAWTIRRADDTKPFARRRIRLTRVDSAQPMRAKESHALFTNVIQCGNFDPGS
jgi:hypothetical protein